MVNRRVILIVLIIVLLVYLKIKKSHAIDFNKVKRDVILQGFHWNSANKRWWKFLCKKVDEIKRAGFNMVWLPPSSASASKEGYLPHKLYLLDSFYGTKQELIELIKAFHEKKIKVLADIVLNHRVGYSDWADFVEPVWGADAVCKDDEWPYAKGNPDTGDGFNAGRDIDHTKKYVRESIIKWMKFLKSDIGYDGWRYDYCKGYAGKFVKIYNEATMPYFSVGEIWTDLNIDNPDAHRQILCNWLDSAKGNTAAFDFTTKGLLQHAVKTGEYFRLQDKDGKLAGLIGWWSARAVTFIDNHDTGPSPGNSQNHWPFPENKILEGYAYILTHPGVPCVYFVHFFDSKYKDVLKKMIKLRKKLKLNSESKVRILKAEKDLYVDVIDNKVLLKLGTRSYEAGNKYKLVIEGKNFEIYVKSAVK